MGSRSNGKSVTRDGVEKPRDMRDSLNQPGNIHHKVKRTIPNGKCKCGEKLVRNRGKRYCPKGCERF